MLFTDPQKLPSILLIVPFFLLFTIFVTCVLFMLSMAGPLGRRQLKIGAIIAAVPVFLLVLQSLGQLTVRDVLTIVSLFAIAYFYLSRVGIQATRQV